MSFCFVCIDSSCTPENLSSRHNTELEQENASPPFYKQLKQEVIELGKSAAQLLHNDEKSSSFQENMQRDVDQLHELRCKLFSDCPTNEHTVSFFENVRSAINKKRQELNQVQKTGKPSEETQEKPSELAISKFKAALDILQNKINQENIASSPVKNKIQLPWSLSYLIELYLGFLKSSQNDMNNNGKNQKSVVQFEGGLITDADGNILWDVYCHYCGIQIQRGAFGEGTVSRVVRLNSDDQHSCCMECWKFFASEKTINHENEENFSSFFENPSPIFDVVETNENTMMRIQASALLVGCESNNLENQFNLGQCVKRAFEVYKNRPALGWRRKNFFHHDGNENANANLLSLQQHQLLSSSSNNEALEKDFGWITYSQLFLRALQVANFLLDSITSSPFIGISSSNRWEFVACDVAFAFSGFVSVGLHTTYTEEELLDVVKLFNNNDVAAEIGKPRNKMTTFICDGVQVERFVRVLSSRPNQEFYQILCMDPLPQEYIDKLLSSLSLHNNIKLTSIHDLFDLNDIESSTANNHLLPPLIRRDDVPIPWVNHCLPETDIKNAAAFSSLFSVIFTSGSSGSPKGVMHQEGSFRRDVSHSLASITPLVTLSYIPLSHSTDRMRVYETLLNGGRVAFVHYAHENWLDHELGTGRERFELLMKQANANNNVGGNQGENTKTPPITNGAEQIFLDSCQVRPTVFISPPRIWKGLEALKKSFCLSSGNNVDDDDDDVFKTKLFSRVKCCATGGGPTDLSSFEFVKNIFPIITNDDSNDTEKQLQQHHHHQQLLLLESYGATETGGIAMSISGEHKHFMKLLSKHVEIRLLDETTGEELALQQDKKSICRGEALIHTSHVSELGYFRNEKATRESFLMMSDGKLFFRSGDIVEAEVENDQNDDENNSSRKAVVTAVRVIDRKKNFLKVTTKNDNNNDFEFHSAEEIESFATQMDGILHACAFVVVVDKEKHLLVMVWNKPSNSKLNNKTISTRIWNQEEMNTFASLHPPVIPSYVLVDESPQEWCMNSQHRKNGFLTVSSKVNRAAIERHFLKEFEALIIHQE